MEFFSTAWDFLSAILVFGVGLFVVVRFSRVVNCRLQRSVFLYFWHTVFCILYVNYVVANGGDAIDYYDQSVLQNLDFSFGTFAVVALTRLFSYYFEFSFLSIFLIFNIFGTIGLLAFDAGLRHASFEKTKLVRILASLLVLLPSVNFWSSAIGKDSLSFMAIGLALWAAIDFNRRIGLMIFSVAIMFFVRPHISGLMIIALTCSLILRGNTSIFKKSVFIVLSLTAIAVVVPFALEYSGLSADGGVGNIQEYIEERQSYNQDGGGGVDISGMSLPMQLFTYLFRPLPLEAKTIFALAASFDNIILIFVFVLGLVGFAKNPKTILSRENNLFMWIYSLSAWIILAVTTANLGISVRQKWMFVPIFMFLFISMMTRRRKIGSKNQDGSRLPQYSHGRLRK